MALVIQTDAAPPLEPRGEEGVGAGAGGIKLSAEEVEKGFLFGGAQVVNPQFTAKSRTDMIKGDAGSQLDGATERRPMFDLPSDGTV